MVYITLNFRDGSNLVQSFETQDAGFNWLNNQLQIVDADNLMSIKYEEGGAEK